MTTKAEEIYQIFFASIKGRGATTEDVLVAAVNAVAACIMSAPTAKDRDEVYEVAKALLKEAVRANTKNG